MERKLLNGFLILVFLVLLSEDNAQASRDSSHPVANGECRLFCTGKYVEKMANMLKNVELVRFQKTLMRRLHANGIKWVWRETVSFPLKSLLATILK